MFHYIQALDLDSILQAVQCIVYLFSRPWRTGQGHAVASCQGADKSSGGVGVRGADVQERRNGVPRAPPAAPPAALGEHVPGEYTCIGPY